MKSAPAVDLIQRGPGWWECPIRADGAMYGLAYWDEYRRRDATPMGAALTGARLALVRKYHHVGMLVDVGIGGGAFLIAARSARLEACGEDINEFALAWLRRRGEAWAGEPAQSMTFWDSIEHIDDAGIRLLRYTQWAFISTPVYADEATIRASRHYKPGEHLHYWSTAGLAAFMAEQGFELVEQNTMESDLGRDQIGTAVFRRSAE